MSNSDVGEQSGGAGRHDQRALRQLAAAAPHPGPHIDWAAFVAVPGPGRRRALVLLVGLLRGRGRPRAGGPAALTLVTLVASIGVEISPLPPPRLDHLRRAADRRSGADPRPDLRRRGDRRRDPLAAHARRPTSAGHGEYYSLLLFSVLGMARARLGPEPGHAVPRLRAAVDPALRAVRLGVPARGLAGVGAQVPGHRLGRLGDARLRAGAGLRRHRRRPTSPAIATAISRTSWPAACSATR